MTITILEPSVKDKARNKTDRKHFHNGQSIKDHYKKPYYYNYVAHAPRYPDINELDMLEGILEVCEKENNDWILLFEDKIKEGITDYRANDEYFESDIPRYVIQLDFDGTYTGANSLDIKERVALAKELMPILEGVDCLAHLSNKAGFIESYPDHLALRIYVLLDEREGNANLRAIFEPYGLGTQVGIDHSLYSQRRKHLIARPTMSGGNAPKEFEKRIYRTKGTKLCLKKMQKTQHYLNAKSLLGKSNETFKQLPLSHNLKEIDTKSLDELANTGYFEKVPRYYAHYKMLANALWKTQNAKTLIEVILQNPKIKGSKTRKDLEGQLDYLHKKNTSYFNEDISLREFDYLIEKDEKDLANTDTKDLEKLLNDSLKEDKPLGIICKSPHGSGKTMYLVPTIWKLLKEANPNKKIRMAYISGLRSITQSTTSKLQLHIQEMECYLDEEQQIRQEVIDNAQCLSIGLKSLNKINKNYDVVFVDESEEAGHWSTWRDKNSLPFHNELISLLGKSKVFVLADADASSLTYSMASRAQEYEERLIALFNNKGSWIEGTNLTLNDRYTTLEKIIDFAKEGKKIFVHVDYAKDTLIATVRTLNKVIGEEKIVGYCSDRGSTIEGDKGLQKLRQNPEKAIDTLFDEGYSVILVSPTIQKGWRYNSDRYRFDMTIGDYIWNNLTAPTIVQRTQRCVAVTEHHLSLPKRTTWINSVQLEEILAEELSNSIIGGSDTLRGNSFRHNKEIRDEATAIQQKQLSNVSLHTYYLWQQFGGLVHFDEHRGKKKYSEITRLINETKKNLLLEIAEEVINNKDALGNLLNSFKFINNYEVNPQSVEEVASLLKKLDRWQQSQLDVEKALRALFSQEEEARKWDILPYWAMDLSTPEAIKKSLTHNDTGGYHKIWVLLDRLNRDIWKLNDLDMRELNFEGKTKTIALRVDDIRKTSAAKIIKDYGDLFRTRLPTLHLYKDPINFFTSLMRAVFQCKVKFGKAKDVKEVKENLIRAYMREGWIKKTKKTTPNKNEPIASKKLCQRVMRNDRLLEEERAYIKQSGKIIIIEMPQILPHLYLEKYEQCKNTYDNQIATGVERERPYEAI